MTRTADAYDELAALFLTAPDPRERTTRRRIGGASPAPAAAVEIALAGHLPVRGALWLGPYADARAGAAGPTALVRLERDGPSVELFRSPRPPLHEGHAGSFQRAIQSLHDMIAVWIIKPATDESAAPAIAGSLGGAPAASLTILSGADEAAVVAAYQAIKEIGLAGREAAWALPRVALALLGCDEARAAQVVERLRNTAASFLDVELGLAACVPSIGAGIRATGYQHFSSEPSPSLSTVLSWINDRTEGSDSATTESPWTQAVPPLRSRPVAVPTVPLEGVDEFDPAPSPPPPPRRAVSQPANSFSVSSTAAAPCAATIKLRPKPASVVEGMVPGPGVVELQPADSAAVAAPSALTSHIEGLCALPLRCPGHESVELAADRAGRLHVIAWEKHLRELWIVERWAKAYLEILELVCPERKLDCGAAITPHLFTDAPASLADLHGSGLRLHVLAQVRIGEHTAWYAAPLNS